jgi:outer membrane protein OmpU
MNTFKKVGLTALGTSLIATSAFAADMSVTGGASITYAGTTGNATGNGFSMNDAITFAASGELDNGWTVAVTMELDGNAQGTAATNLDDRSITIGMGDMGTLSFVGHGGSSAMGNVDDVTPAVYGESWDILPAGDKGEATPAGAIGSASDDNTWFYSNSSLVDGLKVSLSYVPANGATENASSTDWALEYTGIDGLKLGLAQGEDNAGASSAHTDNSTAYAVYAYGPVTVGYQVSEIDASTTAASDDFTAIGITYAVNDSLSIGYNESAYDFGDKASDQENTAIAFSYTTGGMTIKGAMVEELNRNGSTLAVNDVEGYELSVSFAF